MRSRVANALIEMFSRLGVPKEIISDQRSNFMSTLISELFKMLKVQKISIFHLSSSSKQVSGKIQWCSEKDVLLFMNRQNGMITYHLCFVLIEKSQTRQ